MAVQARTRMDGVREKPDSERYRLSLLITQLCTTGLRKDMFKSKRKALDEIWMDESIIGVSNLVRFAPSACNTQPWIVEHEKSTLKVYRYKKRGIMPADKVTYYNQIDMGLFLCFLDLCLEHTGIDFECTHFVDNGSDKEKTIVAIYHLAVTFNEGGNKL